LLPADHQIADRHAFHRAVSAAADALEDGQIILFGVTPHSPSTAYGYMLAGEPLPSPSVRKVVRFSEKPDRKTAEQYLKAGDYFWNSGMVLATAGTLISELSRHAPDLLRHATDALARARRENGHITLDLQAYSRCPAIALDHAIMERTDRAVVIPAPFDWADVGSWSALWETAERDGAGNVAAGSVVMAGTRGSYVRSDGPLVAAIGVEDLIVVATPDAVLVTRRGHDDAVKELVARLRDRS
jgi:mannose-1-phosphate guanylyltransferase/mannose-1-phosphate guanylyltransferase/mannose-6-phosphate isomerase